MEKKEPDIVLVDKSLFDYTSKDGLFKYSSAGSIANKGTLSKIWKQDNLLIGIVGSTYIKEEHVYHGQVLIPISEYMGIPLSYEEACVSMSTYDIKKNTVSEDVQMKIDQCIENFGEHNFYTGMEVKCKGKSYVFTNRKVKFLPKKHGNKIQEEFIWMKPEQEELKV